MASKMFMGDMPELMENILNNLNNEFDSLYSCALVSRHWCKMSIPILWQDPFSIRRKKPLFISNYFSSLDEDEKFILNEFQEWKHLTLESVYRIVNLLIKLFANNGATLYKFDVSNAFGFDEIDSEILYSLEQNEQFFSQLQDLTLSVMSTETTTNLIRILANNVTKIDALNLTKFYFDNESQLFHLLIRIIKSQEQLRKFSLNTKGYLKKFYGIISALESQKNSLQEVIIGNCDYSAEFEVLKNCKNLGTLRMYYCNHPEILKKLNYKISTLDIADYQIDASTIVQILEHSGELLQRLRLYSQKFLNEYLLLETIKSFCPNITYLDISSIDIEFSTQFLELIGSLQKLQFLTLRCTADISEELKLRVKQFAEILPLTLQYLDLKCNIWLEQYKDILINHCNAPLNKLLIDKLDNEKDVKALIEFCIRNRNLNYVGVLNFWNLNDNIRKKVEPYVTLALCQHIWVNC
ncbi:hypothetical protein F8M41_012751 [Gigaspora margarita]|uniref:F-box domain-containing protein n=1 Tax=Gigaspora margarita TaxID=4874 RepID=A0A8H3ZZF8_GIGMA|nr:hypothetical protein F8M41_012751 [Gigaspora margarita]